MGKESQVNHPEKKIENDVCKYAKSKGCRVYKFTAPGRRSVPDRLFITPAGIHFFIEFKATGKEPTKAQYREINLINQNNGRAYWTDSIEEGKEMVDRELWIEVQ